MLKLFSIFNNNHLLCFKENKSINCFIYRKKLKIIEDMYPFAFININNINNTILFNIILDKYKKNIFIFL